MVAESPEAIPLCFSGNCFFGIRGDIVVVLSKPNNSFDDFKSWLAIVLKSIEADQVTAPVLEPHLEGLAIPNLAPRALLQQAQPRLMLLDETGFRSADHSR